PAGWAAAAAVEVERLASFGLDAVSFPIWDLEGVGCLGGAVPTVMSLHTTYALSEPFRADWAARPVFSHQHLRPMIAAEGRALAEAPVVLANSRAILRDIAARYGVDPGERARLVPHGTADIGAGSSEPRPPTVLFLGRFEARKGFDLAVSAVRGLLSRVPGSRAVFAGDAIGDACGTVAAAADLAALQEHPRVAWPGVLSREALEDALRSAAVVLFPSRYESFGLVAIEAFAAGTPVVALDGSGPSEVIGHGENGLLVPEDAGALGLADALVDLLSAPDRCSAMGRAARQRFEAAFSVDAMCEAAEEVYRSAALGGSRAAAAPQAESAA
ncbi:MAG: glycosyltransferase family 4 protein, partial [Pseudomonadota bacterium]